MGTRIFGEFCMRATLKEGSKYTRKISPCSNLACQLPMGVTVGKILERHFSVRVMHSRSERSFEGLPADAGSPFHFLALLNSLLNKGFGRNLKKKNTLRICE